MGGLFFTHSPPPHNNTPRMPAEVYNRTRDDLLRILRKYFARAECPIEAPGKADFGDIDILVLGDSGRSGDGKGEVKVKVKVKVKGDERSGEKDGAGAGAGFDVEKVAKILGAEIYVSPKGTATTHFAIPWPADAEGDEVGDLGASLDGPADQPPRFIQLDLHLCHDMTYLNWRSFHHSHGDLWGILGSIIRPLGLTPSENGFFARIPEVEAWNKKVARIQLSHSPVEVLKFLGLDVDRYWQPFESQMQLFEYAASCRFFNPSRYAKRDEDQTVNNKAKGEEVEERNEETLKAGLAKQDLDRVRTRPIFDSWIVNYVAQHMNDEPRDPESAAMTRSEICEDAKKTFGVGEIYETRKSDAMRDIGRERLWMRIKKELPETKGTGRNAAVRVVKGVKKEVVLGRENEGLVGGRESQEMTAEQRAYAEDDFDKVFAWAAENWESIALREKEFSKQEKSSSTVKSEELSRKAIEV